MDRLVDLSKCTITTNAPMLYNTTNHTPDKESGGLATREAVFGLVKNMWDGNPNTCYHTNFDIYVNDSGWDMRDVVHNHYIQVQLPSAVKKFDIYIKNPNMGSCLSSNKDKYCDGVIFGLSENGTDFHKLQYSVPNGARGDENKWLNLSRNGNSINYIRIEPINGATFPDGSITGDDKGIAAFGIAELKVWDADPEWVEPGSVTLDQSAIELLVGAQQTLTATVLPADASDKSVTWSTSNSGVATVNNGVVTAVGVGTATITATSNRDGTKSASCTVTVVEEQVSVSITDGANPTFAGFTEADKTITATKVGSGGSWSCSSSNTSSVTVSKGTENGNTCTFTVHPVMSNNGSASTSTITISYGGKNTTTTATVNYRSRDITETILNGIHITGTTNNSHPCWKIDNDSYVYTNAPLKCIDNQYMNWPWPWSATSDPWDYGTVSYRYGNTTINVTAGEKCYRAQNYQTPYCMFMMKDGNDYVYDDDTAFCTDCNIWNSDWSDRGVKQNHYMRFNLGSSTIRKVKLSIYNGNDNRTNYGGFLSKDAGMAYFTSTSVVSPDVRWAQNNNLHKHAAVASENVNTWNYFYLDNDGQPFQYLYIGPHDGTSTKEGISEPYHGSFGISRLVIEEIY